jgi:hypothetical protein
MRIYWSLESLPELVELPPDERKAVVRACRSKPGLRWILAFVVGAAPFLFAGAVLDDVLGWKSVVLTFVGAAAGSLLALQVEAHRVRRAIRQHLEGRE